jgi:hypothetical protein
MCLKIVDRPHGAPSPVARLRGAGALAVFASVLAAAGPAGAQPSAADKAMAEALFRDGRKLLEAGKIPEACAKLEESHRIDRTLGTLLNLATCHEQQGKTASAWAEFNEAASLASAGKQTARASFAISHAAELESRLSKLTLKIEAPPPGLTINLNGHELSVAVLGSPIPVDPGSLPLAVTAPGRVPWMQTIVVEPGPGVKEVTLPPLAPEAAQSAVPLPGGGGPLPPGDAVASRPPGVEPPSSRSPGRAGGWSTGQIAGSAVAVAGLVGLGVGSVFGLRAFSENDDANRWCPGSSCTVKQGLDANARARDAATVSTVAFGAGLACVAGGVLLFVLAPSAELKPGGLRAAPLIAPDRVLLTLGGTL